MSGEPAATKACSLCGAPATPTGPTTGFGRLAQYECEHGHVYWDMPKYLRPVLGRGLGRRR